MNAKVISKKVKLSLDELIRYQIITYCFIHDITLSHTEVETLKKLALVGRTTLNTFCKSQSERNIINELEKAKLVIKSRKYNKIVEVNPELNLVGSGTTLLDYKFLYSEPTESH